MHLYYPKCYIVRNPHHNTLLSRLSVGCFVIAHKKYLKHTIEMFLIPHIHFRKIEKVSLTFSQYFHFRKHWGEITTMPLFEHHVASLNKFVDG